MGISQLEESRVVLQLSDMLGSCSGPTEMPGASLSF